jgi:hypothetical protein
MSKKEELLKQLQDLEDLESEKTEQEKVEAISPATVGFKNPLPLVQAPKRPRSDKQVEAFNKAIETRKANEAKRKEERVAKESEERKIIEEKLIKKAISIKKKQIKKAQVIDDIPSDDESEAKEVQKSKSEATVSAAPFLRTFGKPIIIPAANTIPPKNIYNFF